MRSRFVVRSFLVLLSMLLCLSGCASPDKRLSKSDLDVVKSVKLARLSPPPLLKETVGAQAVAITGIMFGAIGGGLGGAIYYKMIESAGKEVQEKCALPDFSELVMNKLAERIPREVERWPVMVPEKDPVTPEYANGSDHTLLVRVHLLKIRNGQGLVAGVTTLLHDPQSNVLWQKRFSYISSNYDRIGELEMLEADNGKLLREEYEYAAEKAVSTFIEDLRGDVPITNM